ncbi:NAD(P)-dependent oxidoreductase [Clostridium sp. B9]|uniref:NAD(P)-dependent oxidoreductase n=1 Tax=Clostridium sp. B9 TaxID=3423224 RepID=UPI003D2ED48D
MNKIFIIGNQNALIESLCHRFSKEGFGVVVMSNNFTNSKKYRTFKDNLDDKQLELIFKRNLFKVVIYLDYFEDVNKLTKLLKLASKYNVRNFIRTADLIKENDEALDGSLINNICLAFKEISNTNIVTLKIPILYGNGFPKDFMDKKIFTIMNNLIKGKNIAYDSTVRRSYLNVNDASESIYLSVKNSLNGLYTIPSNGEFTLNELNEILTGSFSREIGDEDFIFKNSSFSIATGFKEKYSLSKELPIIFENYKDLIALKKERSLKSSKYKKIKNFLKVSKPYIENIVLFILVCFLSNIISPTDSIFSTIDIKLIYIIVIGIVYGSKQSLLATLLSCLLLVGEQLSMGISLVSILVLNESLVQLLTYILVGVYVGYASDFKNVSINNLKKEKKKQEEEYEFLEDLYTKTYDEKKELEEKVIASNDSFGKIYSVVRELDSLEPQYILKSSIDILEKFLNSKRIAIYTLKNNFLRLNVKSNDAEFKPSNSINFDKLNMMKKNIQYGEVFVNKSLDLGVPMMVAPIKKEDKVIAIIMIEELEFSKMSLYYENLFKVISNLIETSIIKAYDYEELTLKERYIKNTIFLKEKWFVNLLKIKQVAKFEKKLDYTLLKISNNILPLHDLSEIIKRSTRETDRVGMMNGDVYILLLNTTKEESLTPINRLKSRGVHSEVVEEVINYD